MVLVTPSPTSVSTLSNAGRREPGRQPADSCPAWSPSTSEERSRYVDGSPSENEPTKTEEAIDGDRRLASASPTAVQGGEATTMGGRLHSIEAILQGRDDDEGTTATAAWRLQSSGRSTGVGYSQVYCGSRGQVSCGGGFGQVSCGGGDGGGDGQLLSGMMTRQDEVVYDVIRSRRFCNGKRRVRSKFGSTLMTTCYL